MKLLKPITIDSEPFYIAKMKFIINITIKLDFKPCRATSKLILGDSFAFVSRTINTPHCP